MIVGIEFVKESIRSIHVLKPDTQPIKDFTNLVFVVTFHSLGKKKPQIIGTSRIYIRDIVNSSNLSLTKKAPVFSTDGHILIGTVLLKLELGCHGVHFGSDFFEAISCNNKENLPISTRLSKKFVKFGLSSNEKKSLINKNCCDNNQMINYIECHNQHNNPEQHSTTASNKPSYTTNQSNNESTLTNSLQQIENTVEKNNSNNVDNNQQPNVKCVDFNQEHPTVLYGILYIGSIYHIHAQKHDHVGTFIRCRSFWKQDDTMTDMSENDAFNFLEVKNINKSNLKKN